jgi:hypothetical protein
MPDIPLSRFVVTSLRHAAYDARTLYEELYCARSEAESRHRRAFELCADYASWATMAAQSVVFGNRLRPGQCNGPQRAAQHRVCRCRGRNHRLTLLKLGVRVGTSARRVHFAIASSCSSQDEFLGSPTRTCYRNNFSCSIRLQ